MNEEPILFPVESAPEASPETTLPTPPTPEEKHLEARAMRRTFSRCGWSTFALVLTMFLSAQILAVVLLILEELGFGVIDPYRRVLLYVNEALIALSVLAGLLVLIGMPKTPPERRPLTPKLFFTLLPIAFAMGSAGNTVGTVLITVWNALTGNEVSNELVEILMQLGPLQILVCTGLLAPLLEELFFRKLLIDRLRAHGDVAAILISALLFGLFHQNFSQFFYAFGIGLLLGYLYCRTGSYLAVTLLHMTFNIVSGVIPTLLSQEILPFADALNALPDLNSLEAVLSLFGEYAIPLLLYALYMAVSGALNVIGVVLFCINVRKLRLERPASALSAREKRKAAVLNVGTVAAGVVLIALTVWSLFPQA